jgi:DNA-binding transcriptional LysR family regulator
VIARPGRGIAITPAGEAVLKYAQAIIGNIDSLDAELSHFHSGEKGKVNIAANLGSIVQFLPEDVAAFQRVYPEVQITIEEQNSTEVLRTIEERGADFGICNVVQGLQNFEQRPYRTDDLSVIMPTDHRLAGAEELEFGDLLAEAFITPRRESTLSKQLMEAAEKMHSELNVKIRMNSIDAICRMVQVGLGISVVPTQIGELYKTALNIKVIPLVDS